MKKRIILKLLVLVMMFILTGCGSAKKQMEGTNLTFDKTYKDYYITYKYPSEFKEVPQEQDYSVNGRQVYEFYNSNNELSFILKVEEYSLGLSFAKMEEDAKELETNSAHKNVERKTIKVGRKNLVRYSFNMDDEFGSDTLHYVYYGGYSNAGVYEYIKIYFINVAGKEDFEAMFMPTFKIND